MPSQLPLPKKFQRLQAGFTMFRTVAFLYGAGMPRHPQMFLILCILLYGFTCLHIRVSFATRGVPGACFQRKWGQKCSKWWPQLMTSPKDLIWTGGTFDPGSIRGRCNCPEAQAMNFLEINPHIPCNKNRTCGVIRTLFFLFSPQIVLAIGVLTSKYRGEGLQVFCLDSFLGGLSGRVPSQVSSRCSVGGVYGWVYRQNFWIRFRGQ